jgi:hypothetical protein
MSQTFINYLDNKEIFAFGDLHGDIHALRLLLELTDLIDAPIAGWKKLYEKTFAESDLHLNDLNTKSLYQIFDELSVDTLKLFPKWKENMEHKVIIVTGDMIDNLRDRYTKKEGVCHIGTVKQEELKIILCLKILDHQAIKAEKGCRVITLLGNHENMNFDKVRIKTEYFCTDDEYYNDGTNYVTREQFFLFLGIYHKIFNFEDGHKKIIFRVNNNIFMHGGMTTGILDIFRKIKSYGEKIPLIMDDFIESMNNYYNESSLEYHINYINQTDILWNRTFGEPGEKETSEICSEFNTMIRNFTNGENFNLIVGHCLQIHYPNISKPTAKFLRYFHSETERTKDKHVMFGTTEERNIHDSYNSMLRNDGKIFPSFIGINTTKCDTNDRIFRLDIAMSKAFDDSTLYKEFNELYKESKSTATATATVIPSDTLNPESYLSDGITKNTLAKIINQNPQYIKRLFFLLVKILSRAPQLLHMTTTPNTEVFRASLINTLKYMCRDNSKIIPPNDHCLHVPFFAIIAYIDCTTIQKYNNYLIAM